MSKDRLMRCARALKHWYSQSARRDDQCCRCARPGTGGFCDDCYEGRPM